MQVLSRMQSGLYLDGITPDRMQTRLEDLPEDLLIEILCRLPGKCLVGIKCVSKSWNILISNECIPRKMGSSPVSGFVFRAGRLSNRREHFIDYISYSDDTGNDNAPTSDGFVESFSSLLPSKYSPYDVLDCCNGLILLISCSFSRYYVCNPTTKQCVAIPKARQEGEVYHEALVFNPCESSQYKIIRFQCALTDSVPKPREVDIFSSETRTWIRRKQLVESPSSYVVPWVKQSVYLDGMLYKLHFSKRLLCFDVKALTTRAVDVPDKDKFDRNGFIGVCKGVLNYANHDESKILIWQFDNCGKAGCSWVLKHCICIHDLMDKIPSGWNHTSMLMPYAVHPDSDIIFLGLPNVVFSYHLENYKLELLCSRQVDREIVWGESHFFPYWQCFTTLNDVNKTRCKSSQLATISKDQKQEMIMQRHWVEGAAETA